MILSNLEQIGGAFETPDISTHRKSKMSKREKVGEMNVIPEQ